MTIRVLHVTGSMNLGGVETWLMHVLRNIDRDQFHMDFLVHTDQPCIYDDEIRSLGSNIIPCPQPKHLEKYWASFFSVLRGHGPYDVVHSHVYSYSGVTLALARAQRVPIRIAHSHTEGPKRAHGANPRAWYETLMRASIRRNATHRFGVSDVAFDSLFDPCLKGQSSGSRVLLYGFDFSAFGRTQGKTLLREELGIPQTRKVVGHVGRFAPVKNHRFLVETFSALLDRGTDAHLLLVGNGATRQATQKQVEQLGLNDRCTFVPAQPNIAPYFRLMDLFVLPSLYEGLPIVVLEAQAAGVPVLISANVAPEVSVLPNMVRRLALDERALDWVNAMVEMLERPPSAPRNSAELLNASEFGVARCIRDLTQVYSGAV